MSSDSYPRVKRPRESPTLYFTACTQNYVNFDCSQPREVASDGNSTRENTECKGQALIKYMDPETCRYIRKLCPIPTKTPNLHALQHWGSHLKGQCRKTFEGRHDNLLSLLSIEVQSTTLSTLTQYYDPPLRCFTFMDFQLSPTR
ncbi:hypothetical protein CR513_40463, partial [Mucuna pruriens]